jgi:hypothetical protein
MVKCGDTTLEVNTNLIYPLRPILLFVNIDVSRHILVIDISVLTKSNMGRREYYILAGKIIRCNRHKPNAENDD